MWAHSNQQFANLPNRVTESSQNVAGGGKELPVEFMVESGSESGDVGESDTLVNWVAHNYN